MAEEENTSLEMVTEIVSSYVSKNPVQVADLPNLIKTVFTSLSNLGKASEPQVDEIEKPTAAQIRKSIKPDGLVSFVDGKTYKTLKRHLTTTGLTIHEYKVKYGLPNDYPTTSPEYSAARSAMAKSLGLGRKPAEAVAKPAKAKAPTKAKAPNKAKPELKGTPGKAHKPDF
jgi:predicted transcriptional regulator